MVIKRKGMIMMIDGRFDIVMDSPMGPKKGQVIFQVDNNSLSGYLDILGFCNIIENGSVTGDRFTFSGDMKTAVDVVGYVIQGSVEGDILTAVSKTKKGNMTILGNRFIEQE